MRGITLLLVALLATLLAAEEPSDAQLERLIKKGEKIASHLCADRNLSLSGDVEKILAQLQAERPCGALSRRNQKALAYYLAYHTDANQTHEEIVVPHDTKCPVCGMFVYKYPKWSTLMVVDGEKHYFDGVKDMMKYYIFDADFPYDRAKIEQMQVSDFYTLHAIDAKKAYYVVGSDVFGPMGNELIPFVSAKEAEMFLRDHQGKRIITFDAIDGALVMGLDGL